MSGEAVVVLEDVTRRFGGGAAQFVLGPATLALEPGSWTVITGRSGAGKTTLLHLIAGFERADRGRVRLFGRDVTDADESTLARLRRDRIGIVHQQCVFLDHLPLWQNVTCRLVPQGVSSSERRDRARRALEPFRLGDRLDALPRRLSGGERQRAALARALLAAPPLLIADEPTAHVDVETAEEIAALFERLRSGGTTLVIATHDPILHERADRRLSIVDGRLGSDPATAAR